jgi:hypothetical protein
VDRCSECGFDYHALPRDAIPASLRVVAAQYRSRLAGSNTPALRQRTRAHVWSPLEYAAHVRDVLVVQRERAALALRLNEPRFPSMRPDELVIERGYNDDDPLRVATQIEHAAELLASLFAGLGPEEWVRTGVYDWPTAAARDLTWIGRHTVHELSHHLLDLNRGLQPSPGWVSG